MKPLISVIIPLFNQKYCVGLAIGSALGQTYGPVEVIVVDDGSTDFPEEVLTRYQGVKLLRQSNRGVSAARNAGIKAAKGEYIQFLDADDWLHVDKLSQQVGHLRKTGDDISYCAGIFYDEQGRWMKVVLEEPYEDMFLSAYQMMKGHFALAPYLFRKKVLDDVGGFPEDLRVGEDRFFLMKCVDAGKRFGHFPFLGAMLRWHWNCIANDRMRMFQSLLDFYDRCDQAFSSSDRWSCYLPGLNEVASAELNYLYYEAFCFDSLSNAEIERMRGMMAERQRVISPVHVPRQRFRAVILGVLGFPRGMYLNRVAWRCWHFLSRR